MTTYEDPELTYVEDISDVTAEVHGRRHDAYDPDWPRILVAKGGVLTEAYDIGPGGMPVDPMALIDSIAAEGGKQGLQFDGWQSDRNTFHVVPVAARNREGKSTSILPLLDTKISLSSKERSGEEFLDAICEALSGTRKTEVVVGDVPHNAISRRRIAGGASNEVARDVLASFLAGVDKQLSWQLLFQPGPHGGYALNVHRVAMPPDRLPSAPAVDLRPIKPRRTNPMIKRSEP